MASTFPLILDVGDGFSVSRPLALEITPGLLLALLLMVDRPKRLGVWELRRRAVQSGVRSIGGRPVNFARRHELLAALGMEAS
jgi:hypothetical protein